MKLTSKTLDRAWSKLGFTLNHGSKDVHAVLRVAGRIVVSTRRSHGSGKLDGQIPTFIRQQMLLNEHQFRDAIECPLQLESYLEILRTKNRLPSETQSPERDSIAD